MKSLKLFSFVVDFAGVHNTGLSWDLFIIIDLRILLQQSYLYVDSEIGFF